MSAQGLSPTAAVAADSFRDPYLDPATGILRNLVGARTQRELDALEADLSNARGHELLDSSPRPTGDLEEFRGIHRQLFQDVYDWAGEIRTVDIRKNVDGAQFFLPVVMIERSAGFAADELRDDGMLRGMSRERFVDRLSYHYDQWNYVHPFREGNGRTQRIFWNRVAEDAGWRLDWTRTTAEENIAASRAASERLDYEPLRKMFDGIVSPASGAAADSVRLGLGLGRGSAHDALRIAPEAAELEPGSAIPGFRRDSYHLFDRVSGHTELFPRRRRVQADCDVGGVMAVVEEVGCLVPNAVDPRELSRGSEFRAIGQRLSSHHLTDSHSPRRRRAVDTRPP